MDKKMNFQKSKIMLEVYCECCEKRVLAYDIRKTAKCRCEGCAMVFKIDESTLTSETWLDHYFAKDGVWNDCFKYVEYERLTDYNKPITSMEEAFFVCKKLNIPDNIMCISVKFYLLMPYYVDCKTHTFNESRFLACVRHCCVRAGKHNLLTSMFVTNAVDVAMRYIPKYLPTNETDQPCVDAT